MFCRDVFGFIHFHNLYSLHFFCNFHYLVRSPGCRVLSSPHFAFSNTHTHILSFLPVHCLRNVIWQAISRVYLPQVSFPCDVSAVHLVWRSVACLSILPNLLCWFLLFHLSFPLPPPLFSLKKNTFLSNFYSLHDYDTGQTN